MYCKRKHCANKKNIFFMSIWFFENENSNSLCTHLNLTVNWTSKTYLIDSYVFVFKIGKQIYCISWTKLGLQISLHSFFKILRRTNEGHKLKSSWVSFFNFRRFWLNAVLSNKTHKTDVIDTIQLKHWCGQKMPILQWADSDPTLPFRGGWDLEFLKVKS